MMRVEGGKLRLAIAGSRTGGHLYPALQLVDALGSRLEAVIVVGSGQGPEPELVRRAGIPYAAVPAAPFRGRSPVRWVPGLMALGRGFFAARKLLRVFRPDVVLSTGGYAGVPVGLAARSVGIPLVLFPLDVTPGWAIRLLTPFATAVAVTNAKAMACFKQPRVRLVGYPVRPAIGQVAPEAARARLGLSADLPVVLVMGGSQGARVLNEAVFTDLSRLLDAAQVIHLTGQADYSRAEALKGALPPHHRPRYLPFAYLEEVELAYGAADLVVGRAGASVLGELPAARRPAILVPGDFSDQWANAAYLARAAGVMVVRQESLDCLVPLILALLDDPDRRAEMVAALGRLHRPDAARALADLVLEAAGDGR
jgi:UDP-N-acetylglucosamine--N-acetylmuramyl-(pentapeptide) pyrophosphoryl-undecaprenol N-acetylglucosamine transferase